MTDTPTAPPRLTKAEFFMLATLAWFTDPTKSLATQMSAAIGVRERTCQYWLSQHDHTRPAPADIEARAHKEASARFPAYADLLDRLDGLAPKA